MNKDNRCTNRQWTPEELQQSLKNDKIVDHEMRDTENYCRIGTIMKKIEDKRKKDFPELTQGKLAEKAGIGLSTYKDYLSGISDNIKLKTLINIANALQCKLSDLIDEER